MPSTLMLCLPFTFLNRNMFTAYTHSDNPGISLPKISASRPSLEVHCGSNRGPPFLCDNHGLQLSLLTPSSLMVSTSGPQSDAAYLTKALSRSFSHHTHHNTLPDVLNESPLVPASSWGPPVSLSRMTLVRPPRPRPRPTQPDHSLFPSANLKVPRHAPSVLSSAPTAPSTAPTTRVVIYKYLFREGDKALEGQKAPTKFRSLYSVKFSFPSKQTWWTKSLGS